MTMNPSSNERAADQTTRDWRLDLVRSLALVEVISVHFLLNGGFYTVPILGKRVVIMMVIRSISIACVPLFMLLTGYLVRNASYSMSYLIKLFRVLAIYVLASIVCHIYKTLTSNSTLSLSNLILGILSFKAAPYSWYVEMYVGLFLLSPLLCAAWEGLSTRRSRSIAILAIIFVSFLPSITNVYCFESLSWWATPSASAGYSKLIPEWWQQIYPIGYFFIGRWMAEYGLPLNVRNTVALLAASLLLLTAYSLWRCWGVQYIWGQWGSYSSPLVAAVAVLQMWIIIQLPVMEVPFTRILEQVSKLSFGAYLVSWVYDATFYPILERAVPVAALRLEWFPVIVVACLLCSLITSWLIDCFHRFILASAKASCNRILTRQL